MLWVDYLEFVAKHDESSGQPSVEKHAKKRRLFERSLAAVGLHYAEGGKIWKAFREMEKSLLQSLDGSEVRPIRLHFQLFGSSKHQ